MIDTATDHLFGRHVFGRAQHQAHLCLDCRHAHTRNAEVHDLGVIASQHHDVAWLDVAMNHTSFMGELKGGGNLCCDIQHQRQGHASGRHQVSQFDAFE